MKIRLSHLRRLINEELNQAFAGITPAVDTRPDKSDVKGARELSRFHDTPLFKTKAANTFKEFPFPVYIVPVVVEGRGNSITISRDRVMSPDEGLDILRRAGMNYDLDRLRKELDAGATVFLNMGERLLKGNLPTPWMIVHALFDSAASGAAIGMQGEFGDIFDLVYEEFELTSGQITRRMTMASARNGTMTPGSDDDPIAELITQAIVDKRGVTFTWRGKGPQPEEVAQKMSELKSRIDAMDLRNKFYAAISGKVIAVSHTFA